MKSLFRTSPKPVQINSAIFIARIAIGGLMLLHGLPKLEMLLGDEPIQFASVFGLGAGVSLFLAVFAEVICSLFILFGLFTRLATLPLITTMLIAILHIHAEDPIAVKEMAMHYLLMYVVLLIVGSGKFSLDALLMKK